VILYIKYFFTNFFMIFIKTKAFTIVELLIAIAIIWIIVIWVSNLNFSNISDKQRMDSFYYKIKSEIETVKNNSLIWKAIDSSMTVPKEWKIDFASGSTNINISYSWATWINYKNINIEKLYKIKGIKCSPSNSILATWNTWSLIINWINLSLSWCSSPNDKTLIITTWYKEFEKKLEINTVSWVLKDL